MGLNDRIKLNNGTNIPCIGYGTWRSPRSTDTTEAVKNAIITGYRHIDGASIYNNEYYVGEGIKQGLDATGLKRSDLFVTSKIWNSFRKYDEVMRTFDDTLEELDMEYVDLLLIHWPVPANIFPKDWVKMDREQYRALEQIYKDGRAKAIGVSNFRTHHLQALLDNCEIRPAVNQIRTHIGLYQKEVIDMCKREDILVEGYMPFAVGKCFSQPDIINIAKKYEVSPAQICLKWIMKKGVVPLPKAMGVEHMKNNADVFNFDIADEDMAILDSVKNDFSDPLAAIDDIQNELYYFVHRMKEEK